MKTKYVTTFAFWIVSFCIIIPCLPIIMFYKKLKHIFTLQVTITMRRNFMLHSLLNASNPNCVWICVCSLFKVLKDWGIIMYTSFFSLYESSVFQKACGTNKSCFLPKWNSSLWISNVFLIYTNQSYKMCLSKQYTILPQHVIYGF